MDLLRHLRFFTAVADAKHFGHAAADLQMTQPPLSQGIKRLEEHLGVRLFERDARGVRITDAGRHLLPGARDLLGSADDLIASLADLDTARLRVGLCNDLGDLVPHLYDGLAAAAGVPGAAITPLVAGSAELAERLHEGTVDVAVLRHPGVVDGLAAGTVCTLAARIETPPGCGVTGLAELALPVVVPPRHQHPPAHDQLVDTLRRHGHSGRVVECADPTQQAALVASGNAARLIPELSAPGTGGQPSVSWRVRVVSPPLRLDRHPDGAAVAAALTERLTVR